MLAAGRPALAAGDHHHHHAGMFAAEKDMTDVDIICCGITARGKKRKRRVFDQIITRKNNFFFSPFCACVSYMIRLHYLHRGGGGDKLFSHSSARLAAAAAGPKRAKSNLKCDTPKCCYGGGVKYTHAVKYREEQHRVRA